MANNDVGAVPDLQNIHPHLPGSLYVGMIDMGAKKKRKSEFAETRIPFSSCTPFRVETYSLLALSTDQGRY